MVRQQTSASKEFEKSCIQWVRDIMRERIEAEARELNAANADIRRQLQGGLH